MQEVLELDSFLRENMHWEVHVEENYREMIDEYLLKNDLSLVPVNTGLYTNWGVWLQFNYGVIVLGYAERKDRERVILILNYRDLVTGISRVDAITLASLTNSTIQNIQSNPK